MFIIISIPLSLPKSCISTHTRLLQMLLAAVRLGEPSTGYAEVQLMEFIPGVDYIKIFHFLRRCPSKLSGCTPSISKQELSSLLRLAQSDRECKSIRYAVYKASGVSVTQARKHFGFENMSERGRKVEEALSSAQAIREYVESLSNTQEQAMLKSFGIYPSGSGSDSESESDFEGVENESEPIQSTLTSLPSNQELLQILKNLQFNWFEFVCRVSESCKCDSEDDECFVNTPESVYPRLIASDIPKHQKELLSQSHEAFVTDSLL